MLNQQEIAEFEQKGTRQFVISGKQTILTIEDVEIISKTYPAGRWLTTED
jgi:hypothetical protein